MRHEDLIEILEKSAEKNGKDHVLTVGHLLNILRLSQRQAELESERQDMLASGFDPAFD